MSTTYEYTRERIASGDSANAWDIDNPNRVALIDDENVQIRLSSEIKSTLSKNCRVVCVGALCSITFAEALSAGDKTTLDTIVSNHKNNV
jgi:hypothetical protein